MASSINTNIAAMTALQTLNTDEQGNAQVQNRVSTGLRVADASDNAAYWSIATTMRSDRAALSTVSDALGLGAATVEVAIGGTEGAIDIASKIKAKLVAARQPGVDRAKIQSEINELQSSLQNVVDTSVFSGQNWLDGSERYGSDGARWFRRSLVTAPAQLRSERSRSTSRARCSSTRLPTRTPRRAPSTRWRRPPTAASNTRCWISTSARLPIWSKIWPISRRC